MNGTHLSTDCVNGNRVNIFKRNTDIYLIRPGDTQMKHCWTFDKPMAPLSTCRVETEAYRLVWQSWSIVLQSVDRQYI